jgi:alkylhydroperoxidase family enzyme
MHSRDARKAGETEERLFAVAAWREAPYFNDREASQQRPLLATPATWPPGGPWRPVDIKPL